MHKLHIRDIFIAVLCRKIIDIFAALQERKNMKDTATKILLLAALIALTACANPVAISGGANLDNDAFYVTPKTTQFSADNWTIGDY
jgi:hypothetical protein